MTAKQVKEQAIKETLAGWVGQSVGVENQANYHSEGYPRLSIYGKLELHEGEEGEPDTYYIRVNETYYGPSGIELSLASIWIAEKLNGGGLRIVTEA